jgi:hypothetical protein
MGTRLAAPLSAASANALLVVPKSRPMNMVNPLHPSDRRAGKRAKVTAMHMMELCVAGGAF